MLSTALISSVVKGAIREEIGGRIMDRIRGDDPEPPRAPAASAPSKSFLESKTIWGVVLMLAPTVGRIFGVEITSADIEDGAMHAETIIEAIGGLIAIYGRATAKAPIKAR